ncbi:LysE family translocator [Desulfotalea psychrophila]|uniref:Related to putative threonine efflux protein n=1 Tax=Desulfotalea psychrophila (strain LSv54 / DSM 12343) TaxID=177439 RepID=Q6APE3_DESPS|nr:LysE family translocator [Desulfotalea psychrophila]CAG35781.1 related to putative threonine efflux protein [Desulfotalea psychrophila LSv54]
MSAESAVSFLCIIFVFAITPGPGVFALLARSLSSGIKPSIHLALGMALSDVCYLVFACLGLAVIAEQWAGLFMLIRIAGAFYLLYLGWKMWNASPAAMVKDSGSAPKAVRGLLQGFMISASNPKVIFFYIAFLPTILDLNSLTTFDIALASVITLLGLMLGLMTVAISASSARRFFTSTTAVKKLNRTSGGIMIGAGCYLGLHG